MRRVRCFNNPTMRRSRSRANILSESGIREIDRRAFLVSKARALVSNYHAISHLTTLPNAADPASSV